jgi:hypothetical protein
MPSWKFYLIVLIIAGFYFVPQAYSKWAHKYWEKEEFDNFNYFDTSNINGRVVKIHYHNGFRLFWMDSLEKEFDIRFRIYGHGMYDESTMFETLAKPGDSVKKRPFSDTLLLIHKNHYYFYRFDIPSVSEFKNGVSPLIRQNMGREIY